MIRGDGSAVHPFEVEATAIRARWPKVTGDAKVDALHREIATAYGLARFMLDTARLSPDAEMRRVCVARAHRWRERIREHRKQLHKIARSK